jgi:hypothetical protein
VLRRLNAVRGYRRLFGAVFPDVRRGGPITFDMVAAAIAEFEFSLTFATAPIDKFARGDATALTEPEKRGALLFFGDAGCVSCHSVSSASGEMFTDFRAHAIGVPQLVPGLTNNTFDGPDANEDFGREEVTLRPEDRYAFRTPSLRNAAVQAAFMHDGTFTSLRSAIRHHLNPAASLRAYDATSEGLPVDLTAALGPSAPLLERLDPLLARPLDLTPEELDDLVAFVDARDKLAEAEKRHAAAIEAQRAENRGLEEQLGQSFDEITRLETEMATLKRQVEATWASERMANAVLRERINDVAGEVVRVAHALEGLGSPIETMLAGKASELDALAGALNGGAASSPFPALTAGGDDSKGSLARRIRSLQKRAARVASARTS